MLRNTKVQIAAALAAGALLGSLAATVRLNPGARADAAPSAAAASAKLAESGGDAAPDKLDRTVLPIPEPKRAPMTELDAHKAKAPPRFQVKAPKGAPNVVVILLDNMGFGDVSTFGGPIQMPTLDRLAKTGLRYNNLKVPVVFAQPRSPAYRPQQP